MHRAGPRPPVRGSAGLMSEGSNLFSATFGGLRSGFAGVATFHMAHLLFANFFSNFASFWPRSAGGSSRIVSLVGLGSPPDTYYQREQID